ncbi:MAG: SRPBCC domain-containing protein [Clostridiales bacterium]|nr:SRPBCC domain-containing protein [Clostridiales bacterium]
MPINIKSVFIQEIYTECDIDAPARDVYAVISDFANYRIWTNEISISGDTQPGGKMDVHVKTADNGNGWYHLKSKMEQNNERVIAFSNVLYAPFLFLGKQRFEIIPISEKRTRFINAEVFSGFSIPFVREKILLITTRRFKENMNLALKRFIDAGT